MKYYHGILAVWALVALGCGGGDDIPSEPNGSNDPPEDCAFVFDFESGLDGWEASGWSRASDDVYVGSYSVTTGPYTTMERHCSEDLYSYPNRELTLTSGIDLSRCSSATLTFWHKLRVQTVSGIVGPFCQWETGLRQGCSVEISLNGGPWTTLRGFGGIRPEVIDSWTKVTLQLDAYIGPGSTDVRLRFRMTRGYAQWPNCFWRVDRVGVEGN